MKKQPKTKGAQARYPRRAPSVKGCYFVLSIGKCECCGPYQEWFAGFVNFSAETLLAEDSRQLLDQEITPSLENGRGRSKLFTYFK
ncbi:hypothetical protein CCAX7_54700 [Capsulimonas corticalis]|uniref:Uncharacterized protein n=1 Tax=Capsulimonas corticalis TaxID=2219043 RepID=A0A402D5Y8_9BACT|nr:hypothetical protein CCAX7_54700 [Capsulimonas corticalis]